MLDLEDLRSFVEVVEAGGFNRAATRLGISKSIVSRRIGRLEAELGTQLLSRTTRGIAATESGLEFKARGERILAELDEARDALVNRGGEVAGRLRVSLPLTFGVKHVSPILAGLAARNPRLEIDVSSTDRLVNLVDERFDAAVRIGSLPDSSLVARRLTDARSVLVASPAYLQRKGTPKTPRDLSGHDCLIYTGTVISNWQFQSGKQRLSVKPEGRLRSDNSEVLLEWAAAGLGIANMPTFYLADAIERGRVKPLLIDHPTPDFGIYVVLPPGPFVPAKTRLFVDALVERFKGEPDWDRCLAATRSRAS
ncbi:MAG: LysR family transcriptional regulator [Alphaproteobacteria bacterium]|nr:LysR family transcriptional regulator [Alphaproteobacteria bacterium]